MVQRIVVAGPVTILEIVWSGFTLINASYTTAGGAGSAILAGLGGLFVALFFLLVAGGARNWMAGTLLAFIMFWGGTLLEFRFRFVARLVARATGTPYPPPPDPPGFSLPSPPWPAPRNFREAWRQAVEAQARAVQVPPAYEQPPFAPSPEAATPLLPVRETDSTSLKPVDAYQGV